MAIAMHVKPLRLSLNVTIGLLPKASCFEVRISIRQGRIVNEQHQTQPPTLLHFIGPEAFTVDFWGH